MIGLVKKEKRKKSNQAIRRKIQWAVDRKTRRKPNAQRVIAVDVPERKLKRPETFLEVEQ